MTSKRGKTTLRTSAKRAKKKWKTKSHEDLHTDHQQRSPKKRKSNLKNFTSKKGKWEGKSTPRRSVKRAKKAKIEHKITQKSEIPGKVCIQNINKEVQKSENQTKIISPQKKGKSTQRRSVKRPKKAKIKEKITQKSQISRQKWLVKGWEGIIRPESNTQCPEGLWDRTWIGQRKGQRVIFLKVVA